MGRQLVSSIGLFVYLYFCMSSLSLVSLAPVSESICGEEREAWRVWEGGGWRGEREGRKEGERGWGGRKKREGGEGRGEGGNKGREGGERGGEDQVKEREGGGRRENNISVR